MLNFEPRLDSMAGHMGRKISNTLVTLSSAAILAIYAAGYERTGPAAERFDVATAQRRGAAPVEVRIVEPPAPVQALHPIDSEPATPLNAPRATVGVPGIESHTPTRETPVDAVPSESSPSTSSGSALPVPTPAAVVVKPQAPIQVPAPSVSPVTSEKVVSAPVAELVAPAEAVAPAAEPQPLYRDGTYYGWGYSRHGNIQASVVIQDGRIVAANIAQCLTRYSCSWISHLPGQVVTRQSADVDYISGATQSANAFYGAVVEALSKAK
jgi:uncharacterized protein with FMN-binding domain